MVSYGGNGTWIQQRHRLKRCQLSHPNRRLGREKSFYNDEGLPLGGGRLEFENVLRRACPKVVCHRPPGRSSRNAGATSKSSGPIGFWRSQSVRSKIEK